MRLLRGSMVLKTDGKRLSEIPGRSLRWIMEEKVSFKREKSSRVADLEESGIATRDILSLQQGAKDPRRYLGGVSGGSQRRQCPPREKNHLG